MSEEALRRLLQLLAHSHGQNWNHSDAPQRTRSLMSARESLDLKRVFIVYPGERDYRLDDRLEVVAFRSLGRVLEELR